MISLTQAVIFGEGTIPTTRKVPIEEMELYVLANIGASPNDEAYFVDGHHQCSNPYEKYIKNQDEYSLTAKARSNLLKRGWITGHGGFSGDGTLRSSSPRLTEEGKKVYSELLRFYESVVENSERGEK